MPVSLQNLLQDHVALALDAVFPPRCAACRVFAPELFCPSCRVMLQPIVAPFCACCGAPFATLSLADICADCRDNRYHAAPPIDAVRSVFHFTGPIRRAVHRFKYDGKTALAAPLARLMSDFLLAQSDASRIPVERIALVAPVPLHSLRRWRRGYNQSALLAAEIAAQLGKVSALASRGTRNSGVLFAEALRRTRYTSPQIELDREARGDNVRGAFTANEAIGNLCDGAILLIDDVYTTGATLRECARVLKAAGVAEVYGVTLAQ